MPRTLTPRSHLTAKRGVFYFRRVLSRTPRREVAVSLRTCNYREAEHLARLLARGFNEALAQARQMTDAPDTSHDLAAILRAHLRELLDLDLEQRASTPPGHPTFATRDFAERLANSEGMTPQEADLEVIGAVLGDAHDALRDRDRRAVAGEAERLMQRHALPEYLRDRLTLGLLEVRVQMLEEIERRTRGEAPLVLVPEAPALPLTAAFAPASASPAPPSGPAASSLVEPFFARRAKADTRAQVMAQERTTLRMFLEVAGDRPVNAYGRGDVTRFLDTMREMPAVYGRSPKDRGKSVADLVAEAEASDADRLTDKTVKRHLTALAQFFRFAMDQGHISNAQRTELVEGHRFNLDGNAREQRAAWEPEELTALFKSPVWTGRDLTHITKPGPHIIRDAKFWLPLLGLFQGARLEELADLYRRDVDCVEGTWFLRMIETKEDKAAGRKKRTLKTDSARRVLPLHPEIIRLGFIQYVKRTAPNPDDPLFPDLPPQGKDQRRGARVTRDFRYYREKVGVYRPGVAMHSFRHTAHTRIQRATSDAQQKADIAYMFGWAQQGGEGMARYFKGPELKAAAATLALLRFPEVDLSHLYVHPEAAPQDAPRDSSVLP